jgi:hypothetical protein
MEWNQNYAIAVAREEALEDGIGIGVDKSIGIGRNRERVGENSLCLNLDTPDFTIFPQLIAGKVYVFVPKHSITSDFYANNIK